MSLATLMNHVFTLVYVFTLDSVFKSLQLGRRVMTNIHSILKSRDVTLPTKVRLVKAMIFPVIVYGYESWTIKKAEH